VRVFRSVGARLTADDLLARARPGTLAGQAVRLLDPADELLFVAVHAAKHGLRELKWLLDLRAVADAADEPTWRAAVVRAREAAVTRAFFAAAHLVAATRPFGARPSRLTRALLARLISVDGAVRGSAPARWERYALELLLEESVPARLRALAGVVERLVR
jgi:hypothetical protein